VIKIILKNVETGKHHCYEIEEGKERGLESLKVGHIVQYYDGKSSDWETCKIEKIIDNRPGLSPSAVVYSEFASLPYGWNPWYCARGAGKNTVFNIWNDKEIKEYNKRPYFLARLDTIKGKPEGKENLKEIMFPCYVMWKYSEFDKDHLGQLVTGFPNSHLEYQLIDLSRQVPANECCSIDRNEDLEYLMDRWFIEVIKGETQMWKIGQVSV